MPLVNYTWAPVVAPGSVPQAEQFVQSTFDPRLCVATTTLNKGFHMSAKAAAVVMAYLARDFNAWFVRWGRQYMLPEHGGSVM